jgi:hypothetical protein
MAGKLRAAALVAALVSLSMPARQGLAQSTPTFTNAKVLKFDVQNRLIKVRLPDGTEQTAELDDNVVGFADIAVGDSVLLTMRDEPSRPRVSRIVKAVTAPAPRVAARPASEVVAAPAGGLVLTNSAEVAFRDRMQALAQQADAVDRLWNGFKGPCKADESASYEGAREWLLLWDNPQGADLSGGFCRDLFNQIVDRGTTIGSGVVAAEKEAQRTLSPEEIRQVSRSYSLDWSGWGRTAPKRVEP